VSREADRQELPVPLRRDVRLLGDLLCEVIRESGGQGLLDDVERLRRAVIAARDKPPGDEADLAGDQIAALVAGWPLARAELVAKAFTIYFHLTNLAEQVAEKPDIPAQGDGQFLAVRFPAHCPQPSAVQFPGTVRQARR